MLTGIIAGIVFVGLFATWVILPSRIKKSHATEEEEE
jgi:hypothetical protein